MLAEKAISKAVLLIVRLSVSEGISDLADAVGSLQKIWREYLICLSQLYGRSEARTIRDEFLRP